jgi:molybdate transport system substrate-binding protein
MSTRTNLPTQLVQLMRLMILICALLASPASADTALIAVAANFADTAKEIESAFEAGGTHQIDITTGATGKLYAHESLAVTGSAFTYAVGKLALYSSDAKLLADQDGAKVLAGGTFKHLAIANPELAPYGAAADAFLKSLFLKERVQDRLVTGENIGQTFAMVQSGAAELGFVAYSQVLKEGAAGSSWLVPQSLYPAIKQDAVLLTHGADNEAAKAFLAFLKTETALAIMKTHGYDQQ